MPSSIVGEQKSALIVSFRLLSGERREKRKEIVFLRQRSKGKKKPDAPPRYRKDTIA
jgi:hypothetical protein